MIFKYLEKSTKNVSATVSICCQVLGNSTLIITVLIYGIVQNGSENIIGMPDIRKTMRRKQIKKLH